MVDQYAIMSDENGSMETTSISFYLYRRFSKQFDSLEKYLANEIYS